MITLIDSFLTVDECQTVIDEVRQAKPLWYQCGETDMYVLGNSLLRKVVLNNGQLSDYVDNDTYNFESVTLFKNKLSRIFPKIEFFKHLGKPGFQIIKKNETKKPTVWHYDSILVCFPYHLEFSDYKDNFNDYFDKYYIFTLMLSDTKSSLDYYPETTSQFGNNASQENQTPICKEHVDLIGDNCSNPQCQLKEFKTINYTQGSLLIQDERVLHRVGDRDIDGSDASRIALQSYGVVKDGVMYLFW